MADRRIVVDSLQLKYQGLVNVNEFYRIMDKWFREKGYDKYEKRTSEQIYKDGKQIEIEWEPWKKINDYAKSVMKIIFLITDIKDVNVTKDNHKVKTQQAKISITFMGYLETDWEHKWETKPILYFLRTIFDQFIYKAQLDKYYSLVGDEVQSLYTMTKGYLNINRYN